MIDHETFFIIGNIWLAAAAITAANSIRSPSMALPALFLMFGSICIISALVWGWLT